MYRRIHVHPPECWKHRVIKSFFHRGQHVCSARETRMNSRLSRDRHHKTRAVRTNWKETFRRLMIADFSIKNLFPLFAADFCRRVLTVDTSQCVKTLFKCCTTLDQSVTRTLLWGNLSVTYNATRLSRELNTGNLLAANFHLASN